DIAETSNQARKGRIVKIDEYESSYGIDMLLIQDDYLVDSVDYKIFNNDYFPKDVLYSNMKKNNNLRWIPIWYFDALKARERDLILKGEPKRKTWDGDINPDVWYKEISQVSSFILTNTGMTYYTPLWGQIVFLFQSVKKISETKYEVVAYPDVEATDKDITWDIYKENFPHIENGNPVDFIIEINGKEMKVYNGKTKKICFDLIQETADWVKLYESFIRTNNVPAGLDLPKEYLDRSNNSQSKSNVSLKKVMTVNTNLKLRSGEATSTKVLTVMSAGTKVKILELGKAETIDGIFSNWVKVEVQSGAKDRDGKPIKAGTTGWCYGGYLK
ncbi:MAG: SH3 domain-containing protein, partial [Lachnospiraceae bacterium]|nr:SH3 domain-containing protein [Lachnospiraceae bacterium]